MPRRFFPLALLLACTACGERIDPSEVEAARRREGTCTPVHAVEANGVSLEYEVHGPEDGEPLVLVMGLGGQLVWWPDAFVEGLVAAGFRVVAFDNRDVGRSTHFDAAGRPDVVGIAVSTRLGWQVRTPYALGDLADDLVGLVDALGLGPVHVVGVSMGGMIAQEAALRHPARFRSLASVMSTSGRRGLSDPSRASLDVLTRPSPPSRDAYVARWLETWRVIGSPDVQDETELREKMGASFDRCYDPDGMARQLAAILTQRDRTDALGRLAMPALVVHGLADPLVPPAHGIATAEAIPHATRLFIEGMGHDLAPPFVPRIVEAIVANARAAAR